MLSQCTHFAQQYSSAEHAITSLWLAKSTLLSHCCQSTCVTSASPKFCTLWMWLVVLYTMCGILLTLLALSTLIALRHCRWSPKQALQHPFITRALFTGPFQPTPDSPLPARPLVMDYNSSSTANGHSAAVMYAPSQGQLSGATTIANSMASSPEARAQAHLAALAAVAQLSPHAAFPSSSLPAAYQAAMLQQLDSSMQSAAAGAVRMPPVRYGTQQHPPQPAMASIPDYRLPNGCGSLGGTPHGQHVTASRHHTAGSDSTSSSLGGHFTPSVSAHQSPYGSYPLQQQYQLLGRFGSVSASPVALPVPIDGQMSSHMPVGSLEALRGGWHAPRGRNAYGDMFASSLTVPSQRVAGAASLAGSLGSGSLAGSLGPPRLPPSLSNRSRHSFSTSPAGPSGSVLSPGLATPPMAAMPNRVFGFGTSAYSDQQPQQAQQQPLRQHSLQHRQHASPHHQHRQRQQSATQDHLERLFDDWAGQGGEGSSVRHMSRQPSLDAPHPSDWDPNFRYPIKAAARHTDCVMSGCTLCTLQLCIMVLPEDMRVIVGGLLHMELSLSIMQTGKCCMAPTCCLLVVCPAIM